jgi:Flp pilus assembly pilin Flp
VERRVKLMASFRAFRTDESGATAIEYALVASIMGLAVLSVAAAGGALDNLYDKLARVVAALGGTVEEDGG